MKDPVKLLGFVFWLFFFNCGQCQDCFRKDITFENIEPAEKASYKDGDSLKVTCMTGFTGMYRLRCEKGTWKRGIERPCAKKKCSHPGDTANGDFKLTDGSEFVFGATVLYTCKKGFEMTSRINQRTCRAQGWDNTVPVCEAVKCPAVHTDGDVTASGNTEEGSYGDVIHFECASPDKKIDGSSDIHCTETGDWSNPVPKCKEITCTRPEISNGRILEPKQEYQKDVVLRYECYKGFKPREGTPKCAKFGWTLNPECDEITCDLKSNTYGVKEIIPEGKTIFRAGQSVKITCEETHWFYGTKETIQTFTCQDNGKWDSEPVCEDIRCEVPHGQHVYNLNYFNYGGWRLRLGEKRNYECMQGYEKMSEEAKCTRDGWTPKPLCADIRCEAPRDQHVSNLNPYNYGDWRLRLGATKYYSCMQGYEKMAEEARCTRDGWTPKPLCAEKQISCRGLPPDNGFFYTSSNKEDIFYSCITGYKPFSGSWWASVTCSKGSWSEEPRCIREKECGAFPSVPHGKIKKTNQRTAEVECDPGFTPSQSLIECVNGAWEKPVCEVGVRCGIPPKVENAFITSKPEEFYVDGSSVTYECGQPLMINGKGKVSCHNGTWEEIPTCEAKCQKPLKNFMTLVNEKDLYNNEEILSIRCIEPYNEIPEGQWICKNGEWNQTFICTSKICPPPPYVENGDYRIGKSVKEVITMVQYTCKSYYVLSENPRYYECQNGRWENPPRCLKPCEITPELLEAHNMNPIQRKIDFQHDDYYPVYCKDRLTIRSTGYHYMYLTCSDGKFDIESCQ